MEILGPISQDQMEETYAPLMDALKAGPNDVFYCMRCDGFRLKVNHADSCVDTNGVFD